MLGRQDAVRALLDAIGRGEYHQDHWSAFALSLLERGKATRNAMDVINARTIFEMLLHFNPTSPAMMNNLGIVLLTLGSAENTKRAKSLFRSAFVSDLHQALFRAFLLPAWKNYFEVIALRVFGLLLLIIAVVPSVLISVVSGPLVVPTFILRFLPLTIDKATVISILTALIQVNGFFIGFISLLAVFILQQVRGDYRRWLVVIGIISLIWWFFLSIVDSIGWIALTSNGVAGLPPFSVTRPLEYTAWGTVDLATVILVTTRAPQLTPQ